MSIYWPTSLQSALNEQGFSLKFGETVIRTTMDIGSQKVRRRSTRPVDTVSCSVQLTLEQYADFYTFFNTTINGGTTPFVFNHPITGVATNFRFLAPPEISPIGGRVFQLSMTWEILP